MLYSNLHQAFITHRANVPTSTLTFPQILPSPTHLLILVLLLCLLLLSRKGTHSPWPCVMGATSRAEGERQWMRPSSRMLSVSVKSSKEQLTPAERSGTFQACSTSWPVAEGLGKWLPAPLAPPNALSEPPPAAKLTGTWDMVTDTLRGWTVNCTHCSRSEANRWGSSARSQASCLEQLWVKYAQVGPIGVQSLQGHQRGVPGLRTWIPLPPPYKIPITGQ